jgi:hypothetical protein
VVYQFLRGELNLLRFLFLLGLLAVVIGGSVRHMIHDMREMRLIYGYTDQEIFFVENIRERNFFRLPFTDIHKISLVRYTDGRLATVFFHPLVPVSYRTIDQERGETRPMPTFEN